MPNQYRPEKRTIGNLLSTTNPPIIVPNWQRSYSWTAKEVETFWYDLNHFSETYPDQNITDEEYFLGSVVIVDATGEHLLLDGQQRLATAAILLSVIRDNLTRYNQDAATRTQARFLGDFDDTRNEYTYKITMNVYDRDFFRRMILEPRHPKHTNPSPELASHNLILKARMLLERIFEESYGEFDSPEIAYRWALRIQNVLTNHMSVVAIFSRDEDNAASVFETLNDRGIGLSTPDLVRNLILRRATERSREEIVDLWGEILEVESDTKLKVFLRHYWISHYGDVKTQSLYREIKAKITSEQMDSLDLSRALRDSAIVYRDIVAAQDGDEETVKLLSDIDELSATLLYPVILSARESCETEIFKTVLKTLIVTFVRYSVIGQLENSRLETILYRLAREIRHEFQMPVFIEELSEFVPGDDNFRTTFASATIRNRKISRYLLKQLELSMRQTEELDVAPPSRVHVEHIYPQTPQENNRLQNQTKIVHRLGNQTLLSKRLNITIRNSPFAEKGPSYHESELVLTQDILTYDEWNENSITRHQAHLANHAVQIWSYENIV